MVNLALLNLPRLNCKLAGATQEKLNIIIFVMKVIILLLAIQACICSVFGSSTINNINAISHSSARISWDTDVPGNYYVEYGPSSSYGFKSLPKNVPSDKTTGSLVITGMSSNTLYYCRVCLDQSADCSAMETFTTSASASPLPALPFMFEAVVPIINGKTFEVNQYCTDLEDKFALALAEDGDLNHEIIIPAGAYCTAIVETSAKSGPNPSGNGTILVRSSDMSSLPAPQTRMDPDQQNTYASLMPKIINTVLSAAFGAPGQSCEVGKVYWNTDTSVYVKCNEDGTSTSLVTENTSDTIPTGSCTLGEHIFYAPAGSQGLYYCYDFQGGIWLKRRPNFGGLGGSAVYMTNQKGVYFLGIEFTTPAQHMFYISNLVFVEGINERITFDRCIFRNPKVLTSELRSCLSMSGDYLALVGSLFDFRSGPTSSQAVNIIGRSGPFKITDNYIRGSGILLFFNDDDPFAPRDDIEIRRNIFSYDELHRPGSPTYDGAGSRDVRGPIELKRGRRILFEANIIENYWSTLSGGNAMIITPRAPDTPGLTNDVEISDVTIRHNIFRNGSGGIQIVGQDDVGYRSTKISARYLIENNLFYNIDALYWFDNIYGPTRGQILALALGGEDIQFIHNTIIHPKGTGPAFLHASYAAQNGFVMKDNILWLNQGDAGGGAGIRWSEPNYFPTQVDTSTVSTATERLNNFALSIPDPDYIFTNNVIVTTLSGDKTTYEPGFPEGNFWPGDGDSGVNVVKFMDYESDDYRLADDSPYKNQATDGTDPGVDMEQLMLAMSGGPEPSAPAAGPESTSPSNSPANNPTSVSSSSGKLISVGTVVAALYFLV